MVSQGMKQLNDYSDDRFRETCIPCSEGHKDVAYNRDHVPSKVFLDCPYPRNLPVVHMCQKCNSGFSRDEEYLAALLGSVIYGSSEPDPKGFPIAARILDYSPRLRQRIDQASNIQGTIWGEPETQWTPESDRIARVIIKNARGHALFELGQLFQSHPSCLGFIPIPSLSDDQRVQFERQPDNAFLAEVGTRMMQRMTIGDLLPEGWVDVQTGTYRYAVYQLPEQVAVRMVLREYLACEVSWDEAALL